MREIRSPLDGAPSPFERRPFSVRDLFGFGQGAWYDPSDLATTFTDTSGTTPATAGDAVARINDKSGDNANATQATVAARPILRQDADGNYYLQNDEVDDALSVTFPNLGSDCTVAYVTASEVFLYEGQTISGAYTLPATDLYNIVIIDRELSIPEKIRLIRYLASKVDGVNYGGEIDRLALIAINAVDVFVYDTTKDSDGGLWRGGALAQASSWHTETLNTATRGSRGGFPEVAIIVAEATKVTIYDGDNPSLPMWMVFNRASDSYFASVSQTVTSVWASQGIIVLGMSSTGLREIDFVQDLAAIRTATVYSAFEDPIASRNAGTTFSGSLGSDYLVNAVVNDVAMTVLSGAPTDPTTGLPVPTIAVATDGGVSVVKDDGTVVDQTYTVSANNQSFAISLDSNGRMTWGSRDISNAGVYLLVENTILSADKSSAPDEVYTPIGASFGVLPKLSGQSAPYIKDNDSTGNTSFVATNNGLSVLEKNSTTPAEGMVAYATSTYNTGWMNGDIKGAFLSDTDTASLVGGTDADRSVKNNSLTVNGTVTRTAVATGADLVAYSGFSAANYFEQSYNSDLDFGTGDFAIIGWIKQAANSAVETILERDSAATAQRFTLAVNASGFLTFTCDDDTTARTATSNVVVDTDAWTHFVALYDGAGAVKIYLNGELDDTETGAALLTLNNASAVLRVGLAVDGAEPLTNGNLALIRISATAPTADQIAKIYADELPLFQTNARATLYGASDAVTALAHDPDTDLLHVGTSAGRSVFRGLERLSNTTTSVATTISASGGLVVSK